MEKILHYIEGAHVAPASNHFLENENPSVGKPYSLLADGNASDVERAVQAAKDAFPSWKRTSEKTRSSLLLNIANLIERNLETLARAETIDNGKPIAQSRTVDIPRASANMRFFATAILHESSTVHFTNEHIFNYTHSTPLGVVGCISPWNLPLYLFTWKIAPALAAGCTVVAKPSELTPMTAYLFSKLCIEAGLPPGVLNIIHGTGANVGQAIVDHPDVRAISFTGGTATGRKIATSAAPYFKKLSLELGGKNPNIIFADSDLDQAVSTSVLSSFSNQGEICLCGSRIFVERKSYTQFMEKFIDQSRSLRIGNPLDNTTQVGALISQNHLQKITDYISSAVAEGGQIHLGGSRVVLERDCADGYYIAPTIIDGLGNACKINQEEVFGPVVTVLPFDAEDEAVNMANDSRYGLSATIWTNNLQRAHRVAHQLNCGIIWVNGWLIRDLRTPFGGMKQSGMGREGGWEALQFFRELRNICIKI